MALGALGLVVEDRRAALDPQVALAQRGEPVGLVLVGVALAADAEEPEVEQPHGAGEHAVADEPAAAEVLDDAAAQLRQRGGEVEHLVELLAVAVLAPFLVVEVLLAPGVVDPGRLDVPVGLRADPDLLPRRGDRQRADPLA